MSRAEPMGDTRRLAAYRAQTRAPLGRYTPRQRRRIEKKATRELRLAYEREQQAQPT